VRESLGGLAAGWPAAPGPCGHRGQRQNGRSAGQTLDPLRLEFAYRYQLIPGQATAIEHRSNHGHRPVADPGRLFEAYEVGFVNRRAFAYLEDLKHFEHHLSLLGHLTLLSLTAKLHNVNSKPECPSALTPEHP